MKRRTLAPVAGATVGLCAAGMLVAIPAAKAQDQTANPVSFPDVPANHWAYQYVKDLADKGYVKGYPDGSFLGSRALTRYEFASAIDRILQTVEDLKSAQTPPAAPQVTQDDLNKIQVLVDAFQPQLEQIQSDISGAKKDILELRGMISDLRHGVDEAKDQAGKAQKTADNSYGFGQGRKFVISGYVQARYLGVTSSNAKEFPNGTNANYSPYNGDYAKGGAGASFALRRSRLFFSGQLTQNTRYQVQFDTGAGTTNTATTKSAYVNYTFGDGGTDNPNATVGLFPLPFGYAVPLTQSVAISPERPLVFSESTTTGSPFSGQDYDRGVGFNYGPKSEKFTFALVNGTGVTGGTDTNRTLDQVYHIAYNRNAPGLNGGVSYYNGSERATYTGAGFQSAEKHLYDIDAQYNARGGAFLQGEYIGGTFAQRSYYASPTATSLTTVYAPGNKIAGYYAQGGYTWDQLGRHPFTAAVSYDVFDRGQSGPGSNSSYDDVNLGYGLLYNLDPQTRLRLWYIAPWDVTHLAGTGEPDRVGLYTSEIQVKF